ncbi:hypothetical protein Q6247_26350, partial [Klebsiella pneumoniae]
TLHLSGDLFNSTLSNNIARDVTGNKNRNEEKVSKEIICTAQKGCGFLQLILTVITRGNHQGQDT